MATTHSARTAIVVTDDPVQDAFGFLLDSPNIDIAVFESPAKAYLRVKREKPVVVIVYLSFNSATEFQLLTTLKLDPDTAAVPIWTCTDLHEARHVGRPDFEEEDDPAINA